MWGERSARFACVGACVAACLRISLHNIYCNIDRMQSAPPTIVVALLLLLALLTAYVATQSFTPASPRMLSALITPMMGLDNHAPTRMGNSEVANNVIIQRRPIRTGSNSTGFAEHLFRLNPAASASSQGRALGSAAEEENLLQHYADPVQNVLTSLSRVGGKLPTVVDPVRMKWTAALAFAAAKVPGDFVETGVFRGGSSIVLMGVMDALRLEKRHWACDSFQGVPPPSQQDKITGMVGAACSQGVAGTSKGKKPAAQCTRAHNLRVRSGGKWMSSRADFESNVKRFQVTTSRLQIVEGWFKDTLPPAGLKRIAYLRLDGDMYNSTRDAIERLEPLVSSGGIIYVDDYGSFRGCALAIDEYRTAMGITAPLHPLAAGPYNKFQGLWWRKA